MLTLSLPHDIKGARFDSIGDFARYLRGPAAVCPYLTNTSDNAWAGSTPAETQARIDAGSAKATAACDRLLSRMESVGFATSRFATVAAVAGGAPCVPAFLAGNPLAMRRRVKISDDAAPLAVVVDIGVSASVKAATIERRGAAALALVRLLAATRPVTLWAVSGQNISRYSDHATDAAFGVQIETAPLDVARAAWLLASPDAFRRAAFAACQTIGGYPTETDINWLQNSHTRHHALLRDCLPALTGCADFLLVPSLITAGETQFGSDDDAAAWVKAQLAERGAAEAA